MNKILETQLVRAKVQVWNMATSEYDKTWIQGFVAPAYINENGPVLGIFTATKDGLVFSGCEQELYTTKYFGETAVFWETLGRYTGVKDRNGKRIFEGDILERDLWGGFSERIWIHFEGSSFVYSRFRSKPEVNDPIDDNEYGITITDWEVIGNIHDNPEEICE